MWSMISPRVKVRYLIKCQSEDAHIPVRTAASEAPVVASSGSEAEALLFAEPITPQAEPDLDKPPSSLPRPPFNRNSNPWAKTKQHPKPIYRPKKDQARQREVSVSSSGSDSKSDSSDDTYNSSADEGSTVPAVIFRDKRMKRFGSPSQKSDPEKTISKRTREGKGDLEDQKKKKDKKPRMDVPAGTSARAQPKKTTIESEGEDSTSSEDEAWSKYRGPQIKILSVKAINDRLDRTFHRYGLTISTIDDLALWWPKTIVGKYHQFDTRHHYLLTRGVHVWWNRLCVKVNSPGYEWPKSLNEAKRNWLMSRIKEVACQKEGAAVRGEREMMDDGDIVAADDEIDLDE
jgi:hypothetical protein